MKQLLFLSLMAIVGLVFLALAAYYNAEGTKHQSTGEIAAAVKKFESAVAVYPHSVELQINFGNVLVMSKSIDEVIEHFTAAVRLDSTNPRSYAILAGALAHR